MNRGCIQIIVKPRLSEKKCEVADQGNQYVFEVVNNATKTEIKTQWNFLLTLINLSGPLWFELSVEFLGGKAGSTKAWKKLS